MQIKISARKSDLARLQAYQVGQALKQAGYSEISYEFSSSLGDQNANDPLWQMPEKGVFTSDLTQALVDGRTDLVVHSWKDLPVEERAETVVAATLPRADGRDTLLVKKSALADVAASGTLKVFSSSPRRSYHLSEFLKWALPQRPREVKFLNVRGNIQTRVRKLLEGEAHALVVAKAALDRLLATTDTEFAETRAQLRAALAECLFMVLPLSECPGAAAQGALAVEVRRDRADLLAILAKINCADDFRCVQEERRTLRSYGGGCHQKIGVARLARPYGDVFFLKGVTDAGEVLSSAGVARTQAISKAPAERMFPLDLREVKFFDRRAVAADLSRLVQAPHIVVVARSEALPNVSLHPETILWTAGTKTWRKLAERGYWVSGTFDGLGEQEGVAVDTLAGARLPRVKLSHAAAPGSDVIATYELVAVEPPNLSTKTHFYWASASALEQALKHFPEIRGAVHACGPGNTYERIRAVLGHEARIHIFLSHEEWRDATMISK